MSHFVAADPLRQETLPTKECGTCTLCCKLFPVPELDKSAGKWCRHIVQGRGCGIHATRPPVCRGFHCQWLYNPDLGPEWKPEKSKFVLSIYSGSNTLAVTADPGFPEQWASEPYISQLRRWSRAALEQGDCVVVFQGDKATAILPDRNVALGILGAGDAIVSFRQGANYHVEVRRHG